METVFKVGDKVFHLDYGWGEILELLSKDEWVKIRFKDNTYSFIGYNYISFTEYTLQGFSQERPIELPGVGELCLVRNTLFESWELKPFMMYQNGVFYTQSLRGECKGNNAWLKMKRIKILD